MTDKSLIEFPCYFPVKIIGLKSDEFVEEINAITSKHFPNFTKKDITQNTSKSSNYLAMTVTVFATNQDMLDAYYKDITHISGVKMVL